MRKLKRGFVAFATVVLLGVFGVQGISAATVSSFENEYADAAFSFFSQNTKKGTVQRRRQLSCQNWFPG